MLLWTDDDEVPSGWRLEYEPGREQRAARLVDLLWALGVCVLAIGVVVLAVHGTS